VKRTIEISASFTGVISTGNYENEKPMFAVKEVIEMPQEESETLVLFDNDFIQQRQKELHTICHKQFKQRADAAYAERIAATYKDIRFYEGKEGLKYPSVTSIVGLDKNFFMPADELAQYAARGTVIHKQIEIFLETGEWKEPQDIPEVSADYMAVKCGSLGLDCSDVDFRSFYKDYPFKVLEQECVCINDEFRYGGRLDLKVVIESTNKGKWDKIPEVIFDEPTILDIKTSASLDKTYALTQNAGYSKCHPDVKQLGVVHLTKDNRCGYAKPVIENNIERYWNLFLHKLGIFRNRYGI